MSDSIYTLTEKQLKNLCYTVFIYAKCGKNKDDKGSVDWLNDTLPQLKTWFEKTKNS